MLHAKPRLVLDAEAPTNQRHQVARLLLNLIENTNSKNWMVEDMATKDQTIIAFDLYGTLLSTESIAKELSAHFGKDKATSLAGLWRRYQLEYTWRLNSMSMDQGLCSSKHPLTISKINTSHSPPLHGIPLVML